VVTTVKSPSLTVRGSQILNADGQPVVLRGFGLGAGTHSATNAWTR
jgi:hypothetical protein